MKKYILIAFAMFFLACDDGDLQIETVDFDSITLVQSCAAISTSTENILFKINSDEALILTLQNGALKNEVTTNDIKITLSNTTKLSYRIFDATVTQAYFCDAPPPLSPLVLEEIEAAAGEVFISTISEDNITFSHTIRLSGITFLNENGSRITDQTINEFGVVTTGG